MELIGSKFQQLVIQGVLRQLKLDHLVALLESDAHLPDATEFMLLRLVVEWVAKDVELNARHLDTLLSLIKWVAIKHGNFMKTTDQKKYTRQSTPGTYKALFSGFSSPKWDCTSRLQPLADFH